MGTAENVELVRRGYEAFNAGDMAALSEMFAEDAVWHVAGSGVLSGTNFQARVEDIVGGENHTVAIQQTNGKNNGKTLDMATVITFVVRDGKITEGREFFEDTAKADDFWV